MKFLVIGGGISGLFLSYYLLEGGNEVILADAAKGKVRTSAYNAGQLSTRPSFTDIFFRHPVLRISPAERRRQRPWFRLAKRQSMETYESTATPLSMRSIELYDEFLAKEKPRVDLVHQVLELHSRRRDEGGNRTPGRHLAPRELSELGYKGFEEGWLIEERSLHSGKLLDYLGERVRDMGASVMRGDASLKPSGRRISHASVDGKQVVAEAYVVACGSWSRAICAPLGYDPMVIPARGLVLFYKTGGDALLDYPAHYEDEGVTVAQHNSDLIRLTSFFELVGFNSRFGRNGRDWLFQTVTSHFARPHRLELSETGVGYRPSTPDQLPVVGRIPRCENGYILTGSCRKGMALAPSLGKVLADAISCKGDIDDPSFRALDPGRFERKRKA